MKTPRIANAIGHIDDDLVSGAAGSKKKKKNYWVKWGSLAACLSALVITGAAILPSLLGDDVVNSDGTDDRYRDFNIQAGETDIVWPWEYQTAYEKYTDIEIDGIKYRGKGSAVSEALLGESLGTYTVSGYDDNNERHTVETEVYKLREAAQNQFVAVKMDGACYVFKNDQYTPPGTFGELLEAVNLPKLLELSRFSENDNTPDSKHFTLNSDDYVWDILSGCRDAVFVDDQAWSTGGREYISFTITSETLGVYKVAMYVTADGYLWTNAFDWQYLFDIGEDAAGKIIKYVKENSVNAEYEPYRNSIVGKIVEITGDYILVDDSILCKDPADGITYKVLLSDLRISRYVDYGAVTVGDTVQISYEGEIDKENENIIDSAVSASKAVISDGDVMIPE